MPAYGKEKEQEFISMIRLLMVRHSDITVLKMTDALKQNGYQLNKDYVNKLMRKVRVERAHRIDTQSLSKEIAKFEDLVKALANELWKIILDKSRVENGVAIKGATHYDKTMAIKTLIDSYQKLFDKKFDAGIFEKQLGKLKAETKLSQEDEDLIMQAVKYAVGRGEIKKDNTKSKKA